MAAETAVALPPTDMLYMTFDGNQWLECTATVLQVVNSDDSDRAFASVVLDRTILHAQGGGQPTDVGTISSRHTAEEADLQFRVTKVTMDRATGIATHFGHYEDPGGNKDRALQAGDQVQVQVDAQQRRILSECHSAGHVVDSAMARCGKFLQPNKAYHFLEGPYVEYCGSLNEQEKGTVLGKVQTAFNELVQESIPTQIELMSPSQADQVCNRQANNFDMNVFCSPITNQVRVVTVANYACPCGGTHVLNTSDLTNWEVTHMKSKKGVIRVKYNRKDK